MTLQITDRKVDVRLQSGAVLRGREWVLSPLMPWSGDQTARARAYRRENDGKTRVVHAWLGLRYAKAPVGDLRFRPAQDHTYKEGRIDLATWGNVPPQTGRVEAGDAGRPETGPTVGAQDWAGLGTQESEDCLTLNLWRPQGKPPKGGWPILVWVHGGGWTQNSALQPQWRGHRLATKGLIVISVEYRLSVLGHFYHPDWESEADWQGPSLALTDVKSALRWVQRHIGAFDGNPAKVTLAGSSAGGECTLALMEDWSTSDLFRNAWAISGGGLGIRDRKEPTRSFEGYGRFYADRHQTIANIAPNVADVANPDRSLAAAIAEDGMATALRRSVPTDILMALLNRRDRITAAAFKAGILGNPHAKDYNRYPWFGGGLIYESAVAAARDGAFDRPLVLSVAQNEGDVGGGPATPYLRRLGLRNEAEWMAQPYADATWSPTLRQDQAFSHSTFHYPAWRIARAMTERRSANRWLALWNFSGSGRGTAGHSSELPYLFGNAQWGCPRTGGADGENQLTERALRMSELMMRMMANLVAQNDPNKDYHHSTDMDLFPNLSGFAMEPYRMGKPENWNVIGKNGQDAEKAPVECRFEPYMAGAWMDYLGRLE